METIKYKGFVGSVEVSLKDDCLHGKIRFINDLVTYEADSLEKIKKEFEGAVNDYIETCKELGIEPLKSYSGSFNVRIGPELHQDLALSAIKSDKKINAVVKEAVEEYLNKPTPAQEVHYHYSFTKPLEDFRPVRELGQQDADIIHFKTKKRVN